MTHEDLLDFEAIRLLKAQYCRLCDTRQWDALFELFAEDAIFGTPESAPRAENDVSRAYKVGYSCGRQAIRDIFVGMADSIDAMVHIAHTPELKITSADTATGIWQLEDLFWYNSGPIKRFHGYGHYHDVYIREGGVWRFKEVSVTRLHIESVPFDASPPE